MHIRIASLVLLLTPATAYAVDIGPEEIGGEPTHVFEGSYELVATGAPMVSCVPSAMGGGSACSGLPNQQWNVGGFPNGGRFEAAWLVWSHSKEPGDAPDTSLTLTLPGAAAVQLQADSDSECLTITDVLRGDAAELLGFAGEELSWSTCRHDVTAFMNQHLDSGGAINGRWEAEGLTIADDRIAGGILPQNIWHLVSLVVGSVAFVGVLTPDVATPHRKIYLYNGYRFIEGPANFDIQISGFLAPPEPSAQVLIHVLEGDVGLSGDFLRFNGEPLSDGCNPQNNVWNGTINVGRADGGCLADAEGTDLDLYDVGHVIQQRDTQATLRMTVPQEQLFTNFVALQFDSVPEFIKPSMGAEPRVNTPVGLGETISYQINVLIGGDGDATNVVITDALPAGTRYVAGSATIDGEPVPHPAGEASSPLEAGLPVTEILARPLARGDRHVIEFEVCTIAAPPNATFTNVATLDAQGVDPEDTNLVTHPFTGEGSANLCDGAGGDAGQADGGADGQADGGADGQADGGADGQADGAAAGGDVGGDGVDDGGDGAGDDGDGDGDGGGDVGGGGNPECGPGTTLDAGTGQCVALCGDGTYFDELSGLCKPGAGPGNADGTVQPAPRRGGGCTSVEFGISLRSVADLLMRR